MIRVVGGEAVGRVTVEVALANNRDVQMAEAGALTPAEVRRVRAPGIVDTGRMHMVLPQSVVDQLGLPVKGEAVVRYADARSANRQIAHEARVELLGREGSFRAIVEPDRDTVLIGAIVLEDLDLLVDCAHQTLRPRDPEHITAEIE
jgi:predicted aspartyl protease